MKKRKFCCFVSANSIFNWIELRTLYINALNYQLVQNERRKKSLRLFKSKEKVKERIIATVIEEKC